jgi:hypothetical protein
MRDPVDRGGVMTGDEGTCKTCLWFDPSASEGHPDRGFCRVNAPVAVTTPEFEEYCAVWPTIMDPDKNWCGRHPQRNG